MMETHYDNPTKRTNLIDDSGKLCLTLGVSACLCRARVCMCDKYNLIINIISFFVSWLPAHQLGSKVEGIFSPQKNVNAKDEAQTHVLRFCCLSLSFTLPSERSGPWMFRINSLIHLIIFTVKGAMTQALRQQGTDCIYKNKQRKFRRTCLFT